MSKKLLIIHVFVITLIVFTSVATTYLWQRNNFIKTNKAENNETVFVPTQIPTPTIEIRDFLIIENMFKEVSNNSIEFSLGDAGVNIYQSEYFNLQEYIPDLSGPTYLSVRVYQYRQGQQLNGGYEGFEWVVSVDEWKQWLQDLAVGENKVNKICSDWGCNKLEKVQLVNARKINSNKYYVGDGYFKPGGNSNRYYTSFNSKNNTIIDVRLDYYKDMDSVEMRGIFSKIESLLP